MEPSRSQLGLLRQTLEHFHPVPDSIWSDLAGIFTATRIQRSAELVAAGGRNDTFFFVTEGLLRIYYLDREGRERNKAFIEAGGFAGAMSSFSASRPSPFNIESLEPGYALSARWEDMESVYQRNPSLERLGRRIAEWLLDKKVSRERELLELNATERYQAFLKTHPSLVNRIPNYHIASFLGITDVSLSRIRQKSHSEA